MDQGIRQQVISKNTLVMAAQHANMDKQMLEALHKFTSRFEAAMITLPAFDSGMQWGEHAQMSLFLDVVNHNETQWMIDGCNNLSCHDTVAFFWDKAARSMDPNVAQWRKHSWQAQAAMTAVHQESVHHMFNAHQSMGTPNALWSALDSDTQQAICMQLSRDNDNLNASGRPNQVNNMEDYHLPQVQEHSWPLPFTKGGMLLQLPLLCLLRIKPIPVPNLMLTKMFLLRKIAMRMRTCLPLRYTWLHSSF